jgi:murein DD-endopeptidase MepM/ murein hydrolase activator NlpD
VDGYPISYEDFKASNFISVMPRYTTQAGVAPGSPISTLFGATGTRAVPHSGLDFAVPLGTPENAFIVSDDMSIENVDKKGQMLPSGNYFTLNTKISYVYKGETRTEDLYQAYLHQSAIGVKTGGPVPTNQPLAFTGSSGYWDGPYDPHLHYELFTLLDSPFLDLLAKQPSSFGLANKLTKWDSQLGKTRYSYSPTIVPGFPTYPLRWDATRYDK